ncbi:hypothetical protein V1282_006181 [Nitrobacteraceae bacterium AZCC 2146]
MPPRVLIAWMGFKALLWSIVRGFASVLNNASLATWAQAALVGVGFFFTVQQIKDADRNNAVNLSAQFVTKYIDLDLYRLVGQYRITQYNAVQKAKTQIPGYDPNEDSGFANLFEVARPLIVEAIKEKDKEAATDNIIKIEEFFEVVTRCIQQTACDDQTISNSMRESMITFYNSVCPYTEALEDNWKQSYFTNTLVYLYVNQKIQDPNRYLCRRFMSKIKQPTGALR